MPFECLNSYVVVIQPVDHIVEFSLNTVKSMGMVDVEGAVLLEDGRVGVKLPVDVLKAPRDHLDQLIEGYRRGHCADIIRAAATTVNRERLREENTRNGTACMPRFRPTAMPRLRAVRRTA